MGLFDSVTSFLGTGSSGSGGTRDAFSQYKRFIKKIQPQIDARQARLAEQGFNPFTQDLRRPFEGAIAQNRLVGQQINGLQGQADGLSGLLAGSALSSTQGAQSDALRAARLAAGGRGGLGFGGGAGALAGRAAQQASSQQSAALAQSLAGAEQFRLGYNQQNVGLAQQNAQLSTQLAGGLTSAIGNQAQLAEQFRSREDELQNSFINNQFGLYGALAGVGLQGNQARQDRKVSLLNTTIGGLFGTAQAAQQGGPS